jgi:hypothetical protein
MIKISRLNIMENITILELMIKDHATLLENLKVVEDKIKHGGKQLRKAFHHFEWKLEKHLFVEERAIFTSYYPENIEEDHDIFIGITKQHNAILGKLKKLKNDLKDGKDVNILEFKKMLIEHKNYEEMKIYPKLDIELDDEGKHLIIERINEMI